MARKSKRASRRHRRSHRVRRAHRGGVAPVNHVDAGWSSLRSHGQGVDFLKFHAGQHGGAQLQGADLSVLGGDSLPSGLRGAAMLNGQDNALSAIRNMSDQLGGRRRSKRSKKSHGRKRKSHGRKRKSHGGKRKSHRRRRQSHRRHRGGAQHVGFAPFNAPTMLLESQHQYDAGGLSREWKGPEVAAAQARASM